MARHATHVALGPQRTAARQAGTRHRLARSRKIVLDAYGAFAPEMATIAKQFFDKKWIDAGVREGKARARFQRPRCRLFTPTY